MVKFRDLIKNFGRSGCTGKNCLDIRNQQEESYLNDYFFLGYEKVLQMQASLRVFLSYKRRVRKTLERSHLNVKVHLTKLH